MLLYYITDRKQFSGGEDRQRERLLDCIASAVAARVDWIQLREKDLSARELERLANEARRIVAGRATKLLVNHRMDVAVACGLDGVHLTSAETEIVPSDARVIMAKAGISEPLIGISCHNERELLLADSHGADFAVYGPVFGKENGAGAGTAAITAVKPRVRMHLLALGGVTRENAAACLAAGADGIAGIRLFQEAQDMRGLVSSLGDVALTHKQYPAG